MPADHDQDHPQEGDPLAFPFVAPVFEEAPGVALSAAALKLAEAPREQLARVEPAVRLRRLGRF